MFLGNFKFVFIVIFEDYSVFVVFELFDLLRLYIRKQTKFTFKYQYLFQSF